MKKLVKFLIATYQKIKKIIYPVRTCRFYPTCSDYALTSFEKYSFFKALYLSIKRILKCHPFHVGGVDLP